jgi:hypothetical protein
MRPAGLAVGRESEELDQEEMAAEDERVRPSYRIGSVRAKLIVSATYQHVWSSFPATYRAEADADGAGRGTCMSLLYSVQSF